MEDCPKITLPYFNDLEENGVWYGRLGNTLFRLLEHMAGLPFVEPKRKALVAGEHLILLVTPDGTKLRGTCTGGDEPIEIQMVMVDEQTGSPPTSFDQVYVYEARDGAVDLLWTRAAEIRLVSYVRKSLGLTPFPQRDPEASEEMFSNLEDEVKGYDSLRASAAPIDSQED